MRWTRLRRYVESACDGPFGSAIASEHYVDAGARVIRLGNIGSARWLDDDAAFIDLEYWRTLAKHHARAGDLVVAALGDENNPVGRAARVPEIGDALVKADCHRLRLGLCESDAQFLAYYLSSDRGRFEAGRMSDGSTRKRLTLGKTLGLPVPDVEAGAQRTIADFLDTETARIDALIAKKRRMIELASARRVSTWSSMLKPRRLLRSSVEWRSLRMRHVCSEVTVGVVIDPSKYFADVGVPFIHGTDIRAGFIDRTSLKHMSEQDNRSLAKSRLRAGDVIAMRVGEPGRAAVVPPDLDGSNCASVLIFRRSAVLDSEILVTFLGSPVGRSQIEAAQYGAAQGVLNVADARELVVPVPPQDEQVEIVAGLRTLSRWHSDLTRHLRRQIELLREHRQALITAAVTGELEIPGVAA